MRTHKLITWLSIPLMAMMVTATIGNTPRVPYTIKGCVLSASDQKPVEKVYVSTVMGEEEALTDKNGNFELNTWQKLPVTLQVQHADFVPEKAVLTDVSQKQVFRLKKK